MAALVLPRPATIPTPDGEGYELVQDYAAEVLPGFRLEILGGFTFDGASIPRVFRLTTGHPMTPELQASALIHDACYCAELLPRAAADALLYHCLRIDGVGWYRAHKIWLGVRIGGGVVWSHHTPETIARSRMYCRLIPLKR
jgi:hypothetical protein